MSVLRTHYRAGYQAYFAGDAIDSNPHKGAFGDAWADGWNEASLESAFEAARQDDLKDWRRTA